MHGGERAVPALRHGGDDGGRPSQVADEIKKKGFVDLYGIYFDFASATLRAESRPTIDQIVKALTDTPAMKIVIEGHTDSVGDAARNQQLSEKRAQSLKDALVARGVEAMRLSTVGYGAKQPVADNGTELGRAKNRRVTIRTK